MSEWISIEDQEPPQNTFVAIVFWPYENHENRQIVGYAEYVDGVFYTHEGEDHHPPSHWMLLPPLPKSQKVQP